MGLLIDLGGAIGDSDGNEWIWGHEMGYEWVEGMNTSPIYSKFQMGQLGKRLLVTRSFIWMNLWPSKYTIMYLNIYICKQQHRSHFSKIYSSGSLSHVALRIQQKD